MTLDGCDPPTTRRIIAFNPSWRETAGACCVGVIGPDRTGASAVTQTRWSGFF